MERFVRWLAARVIADADDLRRPDVRSRYGLLQGWVSAFVALFLALLKFGFGWSLGSAGLIADAVHSLTDVGSSAMVIMGFLVARRPPDQEHPFGHAKAEYVATLALAILMAVVGFELGQVNALRLVRGEIAQDVLPLSWASLAALLALMVIGEVLARFSAAVGRIIDSDTLRADSWHSRSDVLALGIVILGLAGRNIGIHWLDAAAGAIVGVFIVATAVSLALGAISPLLGETALGPEIAAMRAIAAEVPDIVSVHDLAVHKYGHFYFTAVHMEVSDKLNAHKMHEIAVQLETRILKQFPGECVVHVDPIDLAHPLYYRVSHTLRDLVIAHPQLVEFRDLSLWNEGGISRGDVEVVVDPRVTNGQQQAIAEALKASLREAYPDLRIDVRPRVDFTAPRLEAKAASTAEGR
jgi:cation diffusion facilitator family transporter